MNIPPSKSVNIPPRVLNDNRYCYCGLEKADPADQKYCFSGHYLLSMIDETVQSGNIFSGFV